MNLQLPTDKRMEALDESLDLMLKDFKPWTESLMTHLMFLGKWMNKYISKLEREYPLKNMPLPEKLDYEYSKGKYHIITSFDRCRGRHKSRNYETFYRSGKCIATERGDFQHLAEALEYFQELGFGREGLKLAGGDYGNHIGIVYKDIDLMTLDIQNKFNPREFVKEILNDFISKMGCNPEANPITFGECVKDAMSKRYIETSSKGVEVKLCFDLQDSEYSNLSFETTLFGDVKNDEKDCGFLEDCAYIGKLEELISLATNIELETSKYDATRMREEILKDISFLSGLMYINRENLFKLLESIYPEIFIINN